MPTFRNGDVEIAYLDEGEGEPIVLIHGFASNKEVNWVNPGWVSTLTRAGRRVIALDNRGHGQSTKLYDPADYHTDLMAEDVARAARSSRDRARRRHGLFDGRAHQRRCSRRASGARALGDPRRPRHTVWSTASGLPEEIADALEAPSLDDVTDPLGRMFRAFAEQTQIRPRSALAACIRGSRQALSRERGGDDRSAGADRGRHARTTLPARPHELAALIPGARALDIPDRDHMLAVGDKVYKTGVLEFLQRTRHDAAVKRRRPRSSPARPATSSSPTCSASSGAAGDAAARRRPDAARVAQDRGAARARRLDRLRDRSARARRLRMGRGRRLRHSRISRPTRTRSPSS